MLQKKSDVLDLALSLSLFIILAVVLYEQMAWQWLTPHQDLQRVIERQTGVPGNKSCLRYLIHGVSTIVQVDNLFSDVQW